MIGTWPEGPSWHSPGLRFAPTWAVSGRPFRPPTLIYCQPRKPAVWLELSLMRIRPAALQGLKTFNCKSAMAL
jgi:hypothetical protein